MASAQGTEELRPLHQMPAVIAAGIKVVLSDIDDTLTEHGRLPASAYQAMQSLHDAGLVVVPITGRPAGWCDLIARTWPVDAVVGENGAFYFRYDQQRHRMHRCFSLDETSRVESRERLGVLAKEIVATVPGAAVAADQAYREADLAIDFCEDVEPLDSAAVAQIVGCFQRAGANAKVSSIHVNGWFGEFDKLTMTRRLFSEVFDEVIESDIDRYVFIGDSPNDQPMFRFFSQAVGVANLRDYQSQLHDLPSYICQSSRADGFVEFAEFLLAAR